MITRRVSARFAADGRHSTCVALHYDGRAELESWCLEDTGARRLFRRPVSEPTRTVGLPGENGSVLLITSRDGARALTRLDIGGSAVGPTRIVVCDGVLDGELTVRRTGEDTRLTDPAGHSVVVPGRVVNGWTVDGGVLVTRRGAGPLLVGADGGTREPWGASALPVSAAAGTNALVLADGRLWVRGLDGARTRLARLRGPGRGHPIAVHPQAASAIVHVERGACSGLLRVGAERSDPVGPAAASVFPAVAHSASGLWALVTTAEQPSSFVQVDRPWPATAGGATVEWFPTPDGPVEAVVRGDWRRLPRVVIALHGGPRDHWRFEPDLVLDRLADRGCAVVAINQRGSTGHGPDHELAITGAWGGPDLVDVLSVAAAIRDERPAGARPPGLIGSSYGAFLALVAAAARPEAWSGCVAMAAFRSADSLYGIAGSGVRALIDRLDARRPVTDALGERDLVRLAGRISCPVVLAHGVDDPVIPVAQAREIAAALPRVTYLERPGRGHAVLSESPADPVTVALLDLLTDDVRATDAFRTVAG